MMKTFNFCYSCLSSFSKCAINYCVNANYRLFSTLNIATFKKSNSISCLPSNSFLLIAKSRNAHWYSSASKHQKAYFGIGATSFGLSIFLYSFLREKKSTLEHHNVMPSVKAAKMFDPGIGSATPQSQPSSRMFNFIADVVEKTSPAVVYIEITARHPLSNKLVPISNGSGFIIKPDGLILTNAHVVANRSQVAVKLFDGRRFDGYVEDVDEEADLATVRINADSLPVLKLGRSSDLRPGEFVVALGNPLTLSHTITCGVISSVHRASTELGLHQKMDYIQTDAAINVGNSGGPLVNLDGVAIGINTMKVTEGISFAIPSDYALDFLNKALERHKEKSWFSRKHTETIPKRYYIGITMLTLTPSLIQELQHRHTDFPPVHNGVLVWRVISGSPSHLAGMKPGDIIISINEKTITSAADVYKALESGEPLRIRISRRFDSLILTVQPQHPGSS